MLELNNDALRFTFPSLGDNLGIGISLQRTLRIPDDGTDYPLPPGLGKFPLNHIDDFKERVPAKWVEHGGVMMPMYQAEAMWIHFSSAFAGSCPAAVQIATGKINAVNGETWTNNLTAQSQSYVVVPQQPWLDGFNVGKGAIRQFAAMPLGQGVTAEEQLTGTGEHGGIQIVAYPLKAERYRVWRAAQLRRARKSEHTLYSRVSDVGLEMGLAPGGRMRQEIYTDPFGIDAWDQTTPVRCFVHIVNSMQYQAITGARPPQLPPSAEQYTRAGLPWFEYYDDELLVESGATKLADLKPLNVPATNCSASNVKKIGPSAGHVRDANW